jgi:hypothetical protein
MDGSRTAERVKKLKIEPVNDTLVRFRASLEDVSRDGAGEELIHSLALEGTISLPDLVIRTIEPKSYRQPHDGCAASLAPVRKLVGVCIGPGFRAKVLDAMGRTKGCTHFLSLALDLGASHTLSLFLRMRSQMRFDLRGESAPRWIATGLAIEPKLENACIALTSQTDLVQTAKDLVD